MRKVFLWSVITAVFLSLVEITVFSNFPLLPAIPDLVLILVVYVSFMNGSVAGSSSGFLSGLLLDFISVAPIGLNACVQTISGFGFGKFTGSFNLDRVVIPMMMGAFATGLKIASTFFLSLLFGEGVRSYSLFSSVLWYELLFNCISAPILFFIFSRFQTLFIADRASS